MKLVTQALAAAAVVGVAAGGGSAFTANNTGVSITAAGEGSSTTAGFAVSGIDYTFAAAGTTGNQIASVAFTLTATTSSAATAARVRLVSGTGTYYDCGTPTSTTGLVATFSCSITSAVTALQADVLDIAAISN